MANQTRSVRRRCPSLATIGLAVEHYPRYVNRRMRLHSVDAVLLSFILAGRGWHHIDDRRFAEAGSSLAVTHISQAHDIVTDDEGMDVVNVYLDPDRHVMPTLPDPLQGVLPLFLPLHQGFVNSLNRIV